MGVEPNDTHMLLLLLFSSFQTLGAWKNNNKQSKKTSEQGFTMSVRPSVCLCVYDESFDVIRLFLRSLFFFPPPPGLLHSNTRSLSLPASKNEGIRQGIISYHY